LGFEYLVVELSLTYALLELFELFELSQSVFVYLVYELGLTYALRELFLLFELPRFGSECLVDELSFMSALLEMFVLPPLSLSYLVDVRCSWGVCLVGVFPGACPGRCGGAFCTHALPPCPFPPCVAALRVGGHLGGEVVLVRVGLSVLGWGMGSWFGGGGGAGIGTTPPPPTTPCSTPAPHGDPSPALAPSLRLEGRLDAPLVV